MLPQSFIDYTLNRESGGDPNAKNPRSSALGAGQFIDSTWNDLVSRFPGQLTPDGRTDPQQARKAVELYASMNADALKAAGQEPTQDNLYLAHRFGPQGATSLLGFAPETPIAQAVSPQVLKANPDLANKTVGDVTGKVTNGGPLPPPQTGMPPQMPNSQTLMPAASQRNAQEPGLLSDPVGFWNSPNRRDNLNRMASDWAAYSSPETAKVLAANNGSKGSPWKFHTDTNGNAYRINEQNGQVEAVRDPNFKVKVPENAITAVSKEASAASGSSYVASRVSQTLDDIKNGTLDPGMLNSWLASGQNMAGMSTESSRAYARYNQLLQDMRNTELLKANGVQTEGDAYRALQQFTAGGAAYDKRALSDALENVLKKSRNDIDRSQAVVDTHTKQYGKDAFGAFETKIGDYRRSLDEALGKASETKKSFEDTAKKNTGATPNDEVRQRFKSKYGLQ